MVIGIRLASLVTNDVSRAVPICHVHANDVVLALLKPMLARRSYDPTNGLVSGGPRSITSQSVFFSPRRGLSADELKGCFDWYLANLTNSVRGTVVRSNPMAVAAIEQCRAMSYTNAIPALTQFVEGVGDPAHPKCAGCPIAAYCHSPKKKSDSTGRQSP